ncbi:MULTISPECIES: amino acid ABC transporter permease [Bacillaceae]|uniref:amino acid ABC transporter permease n=1 Tax=Bacillaceae TaxID=186817 RepID=UPI000BA538F4|nr:amino acid ABC transporter permease [Virgibacillus sp. 7505]PAE18169.1 amino acid ABC transporter permease [Virgibacillus sp. 7505]
MDFRWEIISEYLPFFMRGLGYTILASLIGFLIGALIGLVIGMGKSLNNPILRLPFIWYVNIFRGTPLLVQIFLIHFAVMPIFIKPPEPLISLIVALALNSAAYIAEIFRAGINSIDKGQREAAYSLGMNHAQVLRHVVLPQAFKRMIPPLGNEFIVLVKDSSLGAVIAAPELFYWGRVAVGATSRIWEPYLAVAVLYFVVCLVLSYVQSFLERKYATDDQRKKPKKVVRRSRGAAGH